jgi:hypothetical protein
MVRPVEDEQNEPLLAEYTQDEVRAPASAVASQCPQSAHLRVPLLTALRGCGTVFQWEHAVCVWPSSHHTDCHACGWGVHLPNISLARSQGNVVWSNPRSFEEEAIRVSADTAVIVDGQPQVQRMRRPACHPASKRVRETATVQARPYPVLHLSLSLSQAL